MKDKIGFAEQALGAVILLSGAVYLGLYFYLSRKGDSE